MIRYFFKTLGAQLRRSPSLYALSVFGVALGVASVVCIQVINLNALSAFRGSVQAISGDADFSVVGRTPTLDETLYPKVLSHPDVQAAWPLYRIAVALKDQPEFFLDVVGFDFFAPVRVPLVEQPGYDVTDVLTQRGWVAVSPALATEMGWAVGQTIDVTSGSRNARLVIGALVDFQSYSPLATRKLVVMDIAQAQSLLGQRGVLHQIDVQVQPDVDAGAALERLQQFLGASVMVQTGEQREKMAAGLLEAFRLNLTALSLISLFVGVFLIYSTTQAALVRRRSEFGMLRSMGATSRQVLGLILAEALLLGALGTSVGVALGYFLAVQNVDVVSTTLTNIYLLDEIERLHVPRQLFAMAAGIGMAGALCGALLPALDISRRDTRSLLVSFTLHEQMQRWAPRMAMVGLGLAVATLVWYLLHGQQIQAGGFVLGFVVLVLLPLWTPFLVRSLARHIHVQRLGLRFSMKNLVVRLQTTSFAVAALATAVSMLIGVTLLIGSFRHTLETWVDTTIRADVFVTTPSWVRAGSQAVLDEALIVGLQTLPDVQLVEKLRRFNVYSGARRISLAGLQTEHPEITSRIPLREGQADAAWRRMRQENVVIISEPLSRKESLHVGDTLQITTASGEVFLPIVAVSYDYSSEAGAGLVDLATLERLFGTGPINNIALYLTPGVDPERVIDQVRARFPDAPLELRSNAQLRREIFDIFDQTFAITQILQAMALLVAVCGVALTLLVLARERVAELALYRALGALRRQIFRIFVGEGLGLGILGLAFGMLGGFGLALILIYVINPAYFGWTIRPSWPWLAITQQVVTILGAAVLASIYPALRASRTPIQELSRDEG